MTVILAQYRTFDTCRPSNQVAMFGAVLSTDPDGSCCLVMATHADLGSLVIHQRGLLVILIFLIAMVGVPER